MSPPPPTNAYTPQQTTELCSRAGHAKARMRPDKVLLSSFLAGAILAFACASTLSVTVAPWYQENAPGVINLLGAAIFPFGLTIILTTGADLCTGSFMVGLASPRLAHPLVAHAREKQTRLTHRSSPPSQPCTAARTPSAPSPTGPSPFSATWPAASSRWRC